ncbi:MAG: hypothetical protein QF645_03225 [Planctomycetota bacterium]|nr:hypothetical protein [Planctomycetota bacterium]
MGKTTGIILTGALGLGFLFLLWFGFSDRPQPVQNPKTPETEPRTSNLEIAPDAGLLSTIDDLQWRLEQAESELRQLKKEKQESAGKEKSEEPAKKMTAKAKKKYAGKGSKRSFGLSEDAEKRLEPILLTWKEEDKLNAPDETTWRTREAQLHGMLSEEERVQMHETLVERTEEIWAWVAPKVGSMTGVPSNNWGRMREAIGEIQVPPSALLPRAHGLHWSGLLERAAPLMEPHLSAEQSDQLQGIIQNQGAK